MPDGCVCLREMYEVGISQAHLVDVYYVAHTTQVFTQPAGVNRLSTMLKVKAQ